MKPALGKYLPRARSSRLFLGCLLKAGSTERVFHVQTGQKKTWLPCHRNNLNEKFLMHNQIWTYWYMALRRKSNIWLQKVVRVRDGGTAFILSSRRCWKTNSRRFMLSWIVSTGLMRCRIGFCFVNLAIFSTYSSCAVLSRIAILGLEKKRTKSEIYINKFK